MIEYGSMVHLVILEYVVGLVSNLMKTWDLTFVQIAGRSVLGAGAERAKHRLCAEWHGHASERAKGL